MGDRGAFVVHGHFYQPPRENPWTGVVDTEPSAAPAHDWNERITDECYDPITRVDVRGPAGGTTVNVLEHMSFNAGPTLLSWLESHRPDVYTRFIAADRADGNGAGGGRAIAQGYGHAILPLCSDRDLRTQVRWGIADFRHRFGRAPEGMWLPETAVSERVLAVLAEEGIAFTILSPTQLRALRPLEGDEGWRDLTGEHGESIETVPTDRPYRWRHPARPELSVDLVIYHGDLAQTVAFGLPEPADLVFAAAELAGSEGGLVAVATDGETFGHHRPGGDRVIGQALVVEAPSQGLAVPRLTELLAERPATHQAMARTSAWSCAHGVGRWMSDCGCHTGGEPGWSQAWRGPLRNALDLFRDWSVEVMRRRGHGLFADPWLARDAYGDVVVGAREFEDFADQHVVPDGAAADEAGTLLEAQRYGLLMYTSCGWFFHDLAGIETVQILRYAARGMDLYRELGEDPPMEPFLDELARARSNDPTAGDGRQIWHEQVDSARP